MIFLHGANSAGVELAPFVEAMQAYTPVRTPNMIGHGGRPIPERVTVREIADDLIAWMDREGIERDIVGGYSFGGTMALYLARHYPERVSGVVALAAKTHFDATALQHWAHLFTHERLERLVFQGGVRRIDQLAQIHAPNSWKDVANAEARLVAGFAAAPPLAEADLRAIRAPVIIVSSDRDQIVPWAETMALGRALPDAHITMFYGPAHPLRAIPLAAIARTIHQWMTGRHLA